MTLAEFLLARLAEDEAVLGAASTGLDFNWGDYGISPELLADAEFFNRFADRSRVLADVEAKRHLLEEVSWADDLRSDRVRRWLALPFADHSDYREEWSP